MIAQTILHYDILEKLGEGGMGIVYKAQDTNLDRVVALKFLPPRHASSENDRLRLIQEAKAASALNHPHVATIYEIEETNGQPFIAMEFIEGDTLKSRIAASEAEGKKLSIAQVVDWGVQIADALGAAHERGIVHRDIKSDNIMITREGRVKIMDFGLAKLRGGVALTKTGSTVGTLAYTSPEQILGEEVDHRTDLWSFGTVLYEMLTGHIPFSGAHEAAVMYQILNTEPESLDTYRADVPQNLKALLPQVLQKNRSKRISSSKEIISGLNNALAPRVQSAPEKSIAVLYFENMSSEKEGDYFCAGITEDIITDLSRVKELRIVPRTDVLPFRNKEVNIRSVGETLRVKYVLQGSVRKAGNKIRITAQLVDVLGGFHVWAERFDRLAEDIFELCNEVSQRIVDALKISLTESEKESLAKAPTDDPRAYDFYLRGKEYLNKRGKKNTDAAIRMFERALAIDPAFASVFAGLAEAYSSMYEFYDGDTGWLGKAIEMNQRALSLDPASVEARFGIAMVYFHQQRFPEAERMLKAILQENPDFHPAHLRLGILSEASGDLDSALGYYLRAAELKPYDEDPWRSLVGIHRKHNNSDAAGEAARRVIEVTSHKLEASLDDLVVLSRLAEAYARFGTARIEAYATLKRVFELDPNDGLVFYNCACAYALLGEKEAALTSFRKAFDSGFRTVANWARNDTAFDSLRNDPEFERLLAEVR